MCSMCVEGGRRGVQAAVWGRQGIDGGVCVQGLKGWAVVRVLTLLAAGVPPVFVVTLTLPGTRITTPPRPSS
jgi:hypothetical protein